MKDELWFEHRIKAAASVQPVGAASSVAFVAGCWLAWFLFDTTVVLEVVLEVFLGQASPLGLVRQARHLMLGQHSQHRLKDLFQRARSLSGGRSPTPFAAVSTLQSKGRPRPRLLVLLKNASLIQRAHLVIKELSGSIKENRWYVTPLE